MNKLHVSRIWMSLAMAAVVLMEAGCGGGGSTTVASNDVGSGGTGYINGFASKGPLNNASVTAYGIAGGQMGSQIGTTTTDANGNYAMAIGSYTGPVMLQVSGGSFTEEATGAPATMAPGDVMTVVMPTVASGATTSGIQITPITSMAQARAQQMPGSMTEANIAAANSAMGNYFSVSDIVHVQPMNPLTKDSGAGASADARRYGIALAAMSQHAKSLNMANTSALVTAMMSDASDGMMDGKNGSTQISMSMGGMMGKTPMSANAGTSDLATAMTSFMSNLAVNKSGVTATDADVAAMVQKLANSKGGI
jgi:hypothetical protein